MKNMEFTSGGYMPVWFERKNCAVMSVVKMVASFHKYYRYSIQVFRISFADFD